MTIMGTRSGSKVSLLLLAIPLLSLPVATEQSEGASFFIVSNIRKLLAGITNNGYSSHAYTHCVFCCLCQVLRFVVLSHRWGPDGAQANVGPMSDFTGRGNLELTRKEVAMRIWSRSKNETVSRAGGGNWVKWPWTLGRRESELTHR